MSQLQYSYRRHLLARERTYRIEAAGLCWTDRSGEHLLPFSEIDEVCFIRRRMRGEAALREKITWSCELRRSSGGKLVLSPLHCTGPWAWEDRTSACVPFVREILARLRAISPEIRPVFKSHRTPRYSRALVAKAVGLPLLTALSLLRSAGPDHAADFCSRCLRLVGPRLRAHRIARANLVLAFPDKSAADIEKILSGMWDNLGRVCGEYAHLDRLWDYIPDRPTTGRIVPDEASLKRIAELRESGKPTLIFAAHLANWELPAVAGKALGLQTAVVFRRPGFGIATSWILSQRARTMGSLIAAGREAGSKILPVALQIRSAIMESRHVSMLIDQHFVRGVEVTFFGRPCKVNPALARAARLYGCPIRGVRTVRLPGHCYRVELTDPIVPPRDDSGAIDVAATMQVMTRIIEDWVREHPEQWLWQHRRWR